MLIDRFGRIIDYLRISVTGDCSLNCLYCRPVESAQDDTCGPELTLDEIALVARVAADQGIKHIRLTGGEPLLRADLPALVRELSRISGLSDLALTTNGQWLARRAGELAAAGLRRVNVSLDSLDSGRYRLLTGGGELAQVWAGIREAERGGLSPVKLNVVLVRGYNDHEVLDFARLARDQGRHVRFIELLPIGPAAARAQELLYPASEVVHQLAVYALGPQAHAGPGPARTWRLGRGTVGIISSLTAPPCPTCNRLRLTCAGRLRPCLTSDEEIDLRPALHGSAPVQAIAEALQAAAALKPEYGPHLNAAAPPPTAMSQVGG